MLKTLKEVEERFDNTMFPLDLLQTALEKDSSEMRLAIENRSKFKSFLRTAITDVLDSVVPEEKADLDLATGFYATAEYRLGELRGYNQAIKEMKGLVAKIKGR